MNKLVNNSTQSLLQLIAYWSEGSKKKKDIFSCILLGEWGIVLGLAFSVTSPLFEIIVAYFNQLEKVVDDFNHGIYYSTIQVALPDMNMTSWYKILFFSVVTIIPFIALLLVRIKRRLVILLYVIIQIVVAVFLFEKVGIVFAVLVVCLFVLNIFIPFGSEAYFNAVKYIGYFPEVYQFYEKDKIKRSKILLMALKVLIGMFPFVILFKILIPVCSIYLLQVLYGAIVLLIFMNYSKSKIIMLIKKVIAYSIVALVVLINNNSFKNSLLEIVLTVVSIFFALDRVISLFKEYKKLIRQDSISYLINEINEDELLLKEKLDISQVDKLNLSEIVLLRQIIIYAKLGLPSTVELIQLYKDRGCNKEDKLVNLIEGLTMIDEEDSLENQEKILEKVWNNESQGIEYLPLSEQYAYVLFCLKRNYEKIIEILEKHWLYLQDETKYILYYAYIKVGNLSAAKTIKNEMMNFELAEKAMNEI